MKPLVSGTEESSPKLSIDVLRGLAIVGVYFVHMFGATFWDPITWTGWHVDFKAMSASERMLYPLSLGYLGVTLFFVLSGYCIHLSFLSYERKHGRDFAMWPFLKSFFIRRFFRIYPAYLAALLVFLYWGNHYSVAEFRTQLLSHLAMVHNFSESTMNGIDLVFWSLAYEWQLYCLFPAFLILRRRYGLQVAAGITILCSVGFTVFVGLWDGVPFALRVAVFKTMYIVPWYAGAVLADRNRFGHRLFPRSNLLLILAVLVALGLSQIKSFAKFDWEIWTPVFAWLLETYNRRTEYNLFERAIAFVGVVSYSFYLIHLPLLEWLLRKFQPIFLHGYPFNQISIGGFIFLFFPILAVSWIAYRFIEKPFHHLGVRLSNGIAKKRSPSLALNDPPLAVTSVKV